MCGGMKLKFIVVRLYCILASTMPSLKELEQGFFLCYWNIFRHIGHEYLRVSIRRTFEFTSILLNKRFYTSNRHNFFNFSKMKVNSNECLSNTHS